MMIDAFSLNTAEGANRVDTRPVSLSLYQMQQGPVYQLIISCLQDTNVQVVGLIVVDGLVGDIIAVLYRMR